MSTATELRKRVESALADRFPSALSPRPAALPQLVPCGIVEVDTALGGGLPLGGISELTGPASSGRTTLALATLACITQQGAACAYVDVSDSFDPFSAASSGVDLRRLLWVRAGETSLSSQASSFSTATAASSLTAPEKRATDRGGRHPRTEAQGMDRAIGELFSGARQTEHASDFTPRYSESIRRKRIEPVISMPRRQPDRPWNARVLPGSGPQKPWPQLEKSLRAADLLLNTGGFRAIVLDMGDVRPEYARRVPLATWYRFRMQVEKAQMVFLLLTSVACANSCAAVSLHCEEAKSDWNQAEENSPSLLTGLQYRISVARSRAADPYRKKPAASAQADWNSATPWSR